MATLITIGGYEFTAHPEDGKAFTLRELQGYVGGYIERIGLPDGTSMYVNEEGVLERLAHNRRASELASPHYVVGQVIICTDAEIGEDEEDGWPPDADMVIAQENN